MRVARRPPDPRLRPDLFAEGEEVGDRGKPLRTSGVGEPALGHHRHFDHLAPPLEQLRLGRRAVAESGLAHRAEAHVIRPVFAGNQAFVARGAAEGADDGVLAEIGAGLAHVPGAVGEMHPVEPVVLGDQLVIGEHDGDVAGVADLAQRVRAAPDRVFVAGGEVEPDAGNLDGIEGAREQVGKDVEIEARGGDEVDLRQVLVGHRGFRQAPVRRVGPGPYAGLRICAPQGAWALGRVDRAVAGRQGAHVCEGTWEAGAGMIAREGVVGARVFEGRRRLDNR